MSQLAVQVLFTPQIRSAQSTPAIGRTEDNRVQASGKTRPKDISELIESHSFFFFLHFYLHINQKPRVCSIIIIIL